MRLTILGSGTCASQLPGIPNRYPPAFVVEWGTMTADERVLFDCGEGTRFRLEEAGYDYASLRHVAISHAHPDHCALVHLIQSMLCSGYWGKTRPSEIAVYCPDQIERDFPLVWNFHVPDMQGEYYEFPKPHFHPLSSGQPAISIGEATLSARRVYHGFGRIDSVAFRLQAAGRVFVYSGDTGDCDGIREITQGADVFVCDASARIGDDSSPLQYGHLNPHAAATIAHASGVRHLILTHYTGLDGDDALIADAKRSGYQGKVTVAKDGMRVAA